MERDEKTEATGATATCRFCRASLTTTVVDLGMSPLCESFLAAEQLNGMEPFYPLHVYVCDDCYLVQLEEYVAPEDIFREYAYFSSFSDSWLKHASDYADAMVERLGLGTESFVVELASNDGYLLKNFVDKQIPVLGIEPAINVAKKAEEKGVRTLTEFFGERLAERVVGEHGHADLVAGNNVLAQVPDLNDFVAGIGKLLGPTATGTFEFPHLMTLFEGNQLDTIYHEHFSYFSFLSIMKIFAAHGMKIHDVESLWTHGGSLRIFVSHEADESKQPSEAVTALLQREVEAGYEGGDAYRNFDEQAKETKRRLLEFLIEAKRAGKRVAGYGAPGKGNTLLNYCGIRRDFLDYTVDRNPYKQGKFLPGTHIPIHHPDHLRADKPDIVLILPWNFRDEIMEQVSYIRDWGGIFVVPIPEVTVYS